MLDGCVKVIEGCGYDTDGKKIFNAMAVIGYDAASQDLVMRSHAEGRVGNFSLEARDDGFDWEVPAGPNKIRYTAKIDDGWFELRRAQSSESALVCPTEAVERKLESMWIATSQISPTEFSTAFGTTRERGYWTGTRHRRDALLLG